MYISELRIKNFRNFGDPPLVLPLRPFTLILGENNVGKSNLLCAVALLFGQDLSAAQRRTLETDDFNYRALAEFRSQALDPNVAPGDVAFPEILIEATLDSISNEQHPVVGDWYSNTALTQAKVSYRFSLRGNFDRKKWVDETRAAIAARKSRDAAEHPAEALPEDHPPFDYSQLVELPICEYRYLIYGGGRPSSECEAYLLRMLRAEILDALRDAERELVGSGDQRLLFRVLRQNSKSGYADIKRLLTELKEAIDIDPSLTAIRTDVEALLKLVSLQTPGESHAIGLQFAAPEAAEVLRRIGMTYGANPTTVARNGLGRNNLLYVALLLSQLAKSAGSPVNDEGFVCFRLIGIEEPEAHLHPHLQDHLARNIELIRSQHSDALQLILTSHSTHIAAKLDLANTAVLFRSDDTGQLAIHYVLDGLDVVRHKAAIRFLRLYLDATKSRMFFARRLILVEGIAEQTVLPELFEQINGDSLESVGCTIVNVNGVAFRNFLEVFKNGFFKRCVVLTDSDAGTATANRAESLRADFADVHHIRIETTATSTFEKDLVAANKSGESRELLFSALTLAKPKAGPKFKDVTGNDDIDVEAFFGEIEEHKAEFAFSLASVLRQERNDAKRGGRPALALTVPAYITAALSFVKE